MTVHFIGAGPGAADLITVRGRELIAAVAGLPVRRRLVPRRTARTTARPAPGWSTPPDLTLDEIIAEMVAAHAAGQDVARLHSGDPSVFSAMAEQMRRLDAAGVPVRRHARRTGLRGGGRGAGPRADRARASARRSS